MVPRNNSIGIHHHEKKPASSESEIRESRPTTRTFNFQLSFVQYYTHTLYVRTLLPRTIVNRTYGTHKSLTYVAIFTLRSPALTRSIVQTWYFGGGRFAIGVFVSCFFLRYPSASELFYMEAVLWPRDCTVMWR